MPAQRSLREYSSVFFIWGKCPHCQKLIDEGRQITERHAYNQRRWLEKISLTDAIADRQITELTRADVLDFRARLTRKLGAKVNTANKTLAVLKTILKEAVFREDLSRDPTAHVGNLKEHRKEAGYFTADELRALFPLEGLGPWSDLQTKICFLVAGSTGMRRGETLALNWKHVDFEKNLIRVDQAWKSADVIGTQKWGTQARFPAARCYSGGAHGALGPKASQLAGADSLVFCYADIERALWGARLGDTWWTKNFASAMEKLRSTRELGASSRTASGTQSPRCAGTPARTRESARPWAGRTSAHRGTTNTLRRRC